jgi:hypothetical protein
MAGEAPRWRQARVTTATATATAGEAPRGDDERREDKGNGYVQGEGGRGEGNCGGGGSGDGGGDNGDDDNGGGDNDNSGIDDNDDGGDNKDEDVSDDHNGGNGGDGGGGCNTVKAVGIDRQVNNQLKVAIDTGRGRPRGAMVHPCEFFSFCILHFAKNVAWEQRSLSGKVLFPAKRARPHF